MRSEWPAAVAEMFRVLKPGGAIQFTDTETDTYSAETQDGTGRRSRTRMELKLLLEWVMHLPEVMKEAGFVDVRINCPNLSSNPIDWTAVVEGAGRLAMDDLITNSRFSDVHSSRSQIKTLVISASKPL